MIALTGHAAALRELLHALVLTHELSVSLVILICVRVPNDYQHRMEIGSQN